MERGNTTHSRGSQQRGEQTERMVDTTPSGQPEVGRRPLRQAMNLAGKRLGLPTPPATVDDLDAILPPLDAEGEEELIRITSDTYLDQVLTDPASNRARRP